MQTFASTPPERDLVFIGGGHTHALTLRMLAMKPIAGVRLTLISDTVLTPYSGMLPGYLAGHYSVDETHIDLIKLCRVGNVRFIHDQVVGLNPDTKKISLKNHADIQYDKVSINTGSTPNLTIPGAKEFAIGVKPVSRLAKVWQKLTTEVHESGAPHWAVVGGGAAGVEVTLAIAERYINNKQPVQLSLVFSSDTILPSYTAKLRQKTEQALDKAGVKLWPNFTVAQVNKNALMSSDHQILNIHQSIWCTPSVAPSWPKAAGLNVDDFGFIAVNTYLQSTSHPDVFASGDVSAMIQNPRPKAGVFAVRSAPFLMHNLTAVFGQKNLKPLKLQNDFLSLISLGGKTAVGQRNGISFHGKWAWRWKDRIDRKFMALFDQNLPDMPTMEEELMHCAGCGSKLGPELLNETLAEIHQVDHAPAEDAALALSTQHHQLWQSIDGFRSFTDDYFRLGQVATHHAVNDCYAMGILPSSAQVWANLKFSHPRLTRRDFKFLMSGITQALAHHDTELIGGHSTEGAETHIALVINGEGNAKWPKRGAQQGDWLLLNKPIGSGILLAAQMQGRAHATAIESLWTHLLASNRNYFMQIQNEEIHAATDITGFGLVGHLLEMFEGTQCTARIHCDQIPLMDDALALSETNVSSTLLPQLEPMLAKCEVTQSSQALVRCLLDPQTQGGLLISAPPETAKAIMADTNVWKIGEVTTQKEKPVILL